MAGARVTICLPFFDDRCRGLAIKANKIRDARSYAEGYSAAAFSLLRRKKDSVLYASNYSLAPFLSQWKIRLRPVGSAPLPLRNEKAALGLLPRRTRANSMV
jgi:hypothetical protein